jgi:hypothetical protein
MSRRVIISIYSLMPLALLLFACSPAALSDQDRIATQVAEAEAVAATLTAKAPLPPVSTSTLTPTPPPPETATTELPPTNTPTSLPSPPTSAPSTNTPTPPPATPIAALPTPTQPLYDVLEVDGDDGNQAVRGGQPLNEGRYLILPGYSPGTIDRQNPIFLDKLALRVEVFDSAHGGTQDGDGIQNVTFKLTRDGDPDHPVYEKVESTPGYCLFGGGEPNCESWVFAQHEYRWPSGQPIENTDYRLVITITPQTGDQAIWNWGFSIEGMPEVASGSEQIAAEIIQTGPNSDADVVSDALVFQVFASTNGSDDGAGIDRVDMRIIGPQGEIYQRTEQNAAYCAFSGGEPDCNIWDFAEHDYQWPNGDPIEPGNYALRATVYTDDGSSSIVEKSILIQ